MKKIALVINLYDPLNPSSGGAVQRIYDNLILYNEKHPTFLLSVVGARSKHKDLQYTKFYDAHINKFKMFFLKVFRRLSKKDCVLNHIEKVTIKKLNKLDFDYCIFSQSNKDFQKDVVLDSVPYEKRILYSHVFREGSDAYLKRFANIIVVSEYLRQQFSKENQKHVYVLPNYSMTYQDKMNITRETLHYKKDDVIFLYVGRTVEQKGIPELINAFKRLNSENAKLLIIGKCNFGLVDKLTDYEMKLSTICAESNGTIRWLGFIPDTQLVNYRKLADACVVPSRTKEAFCLVALEAMMDKRPLIASDDGALEELSEGCCLRVHVNNLEDELYSQMKIILEHKYDQTLIEKAYERSKNYSIESYIKTLATIFNEL